MACSEKDVDSCDRDISPDLKIFLYILEHLKHKYSIALGRSDSKSLSMKYIFNADGYQNVASSILDLNITVYDDKASFAFGTISPISNEYNFDNPKFPNNMIKRIDEVVDSFINFVNVINNVDDDS